MMQHHTLPNTTTFERLWDGTVPAAGLKCHRLPLDKVRFSVTIVNPDRHQIHLIFGLMQFNSGAHKHLQSVEKPPVNSKTL